MSKLEHIYTNYLTPFLRQRYSNFDFYKLTFLHEPSHIGSFDDYHKVNLYVADKQTIYLVSFHVFETFIKPASISLTVSPDNIISDLINIEYTITDYSNLNYYVYCSNYTLYLSWHMSSNLSPFLMLDCIYKDSLNKKQYIYCADGNIDNFLINLDILNESLAKIIKAHYDEYHNYLCAFTVLNKFNTRHNE